MLCHYVCYVTMWSLNMCIALFEPDRSSTFKDFSVRTCSITCVGWRLQWRAAAMGSWTRSMKQLPIWRRRKVWKWTCCYVVAIFRQWGMRKTWSPWQYQQSTERCRLFTSKSFGLTLSCILAQSVRKYSHFKLINFRYYSGEKKAPVLTIFIGGNHEASNHLQELPYGGWVAPNIYFLGRVSKYSL